MKKFLLLMLVAAFCLNCGGSGAGSTTASKPAPANTTSLAPPANKPASPPASKPDEASNPDLDFTIVNKTGYDLKELSIGATGTGDWTPEDEVLKGKTFANGSSLDIKFHPRATAEKWDIKVTWADGSGSVEWVGLNLTKITKATLVYDKDTDKTTAVIE